MNLYDKAHVEDQVNIFKEQEPPEVNNVKHKQTNKFKCLIFVFLKICFRKKMKMTGSTFLLEDNKIQSYARLNTFHFIRI